MLLLVSGLQLYSMLGIPRDKMVLGLPWYGYNYPCSAYDAVVSDCKLYSIEYCKFVRCL